MPAQGSPAEPAQKVKGRQTVEQARVGLTQGQAVPRPCEPDARISDVIIAAARWPASACRHGP